MEDRIDDSDEDEFQEERAGRCSICTLSDPHARSLPVVGPGEVDDAWFSSSSKWSNAQCGGSCGQQQPDLLKDIVAIKLFKCSTDRSGSRAVDVGQSGPSGHRSNPLSSRTPQCGNHKPKHGCRSISRSLTSSDIYEAHYNRVPIASQKKGKRSRLIKSCIAQ